MHKNPECNYNSSEIDIQLRQLVALAMEIAVNPFTILTHCNTIQISNTSTNLEKENDDAGGSLVRFCLGLLLYLTLREALR